MGLEDSLPHDYFTLFDIFFYQPLREDTTWDAYVRHPELMQELIVSCYDELARNYAYICLRWKSWVLLAGGEEKKAYQYMQRLVKWYPKAFLYETLGDIAYAQDDLAAAKQRFIKSISATEDEDIRQQVADKVKKTLRVSQTAK